MLKLHKVLFHNSRVCLQSLSSSYECSAVTMTMSVWLIHAASEQTRHNRELIMWRTNCCTVLKVSSVQQSTVCPVSHVTSTIFRLDVMD